MNLEIVRKDLESRREEVNKFIEFLKLIENGEWLLANSDMVKVNFPTIVKTTHKASSIILIYNVVESTITKCLVSVHDAICLEQLGYFELTDNIQKISLVYHNSLVEKKDSFHDSAGYIQKFLENLFNYSKFSLTYDELAKYYSLYSGNLDSREIKNVLSKYGICFEAEVSELLTVKNGRNQLAHGEKSFEEYGRELTIQYLEVISKESFKYLEAVIKEVDEFIRLKSFKVIR